MRLAPGLSRSIRADCDALKLSVDPSDAFAQTAAHRFLGYGTAEQTLNCQMDVGGAHRTVSGRQNLDDRSLHDAVAEPAFFWRRRRPLSWL